jgi:hypothetical protein
MAIDFPASPTLNQQFSAGGSTWVWDGTAWNIVPVMIDAIASDTPPTNPADGQLWWRASTGQLYVYYNDGTSKAWVQAAGAASSPGLWEPISVQEFPAMAAVTALNLDPFVDLRIKLRAFVASAQPIFMQFSSDNGATWISGASSYFHSQIGWVTTVTATQPASNAFQLSNGANVLSGGVTMGLSMDMAIEGFNKAARSTHMVARGVFTRATDSLQSSLDFDGWVSGSHNALKIFAGANINGHLTIEGVRG